MRLRDLKDKLQGTQKRLERAEALLREGMYALYGAYDEAHDPTGCGDHGECHDIAEKISKFVNAPIDTVE